MSKVLDKYIGNTYLHARYKKVEVLSAVPKSRTLVEIKIIERGPGYDPDKQKYTGVKSKSGWYRGENYAYGTITTTHYKELQQLKPATSEDS
jgi:hypothetical protein